jgi:rhamnosyltransferase
MNNPLVSVIIRTKNEEYWLETVIKKLLAQTYKNLELIVIDSGSTDRTLEIVSKYPQVTLMHYKGVFSYGKAINDGIRGSKGEYIAILSGHSIPVSKNMMLDGVRVLQKYSDTAGLSGHYSPPWGDTLDKTSIWSRVKKSLEFSQNNTHISNTNSLIRRDCWDLYRFDEELTECEDYDWALEMRSRGYDIIKSGKFNIYHSHSHIKGGKTFQERQIVWNAINRQLENKPRPTPLV